MSREKQKTQGEAKMQNREKQIEEMAKVIDEASEFTVLGLNDAAMKVKLVCERVAEKLYNAGYRKQSENTVEVVRCYDCKYCEVVTDSIIDEPKYFCTRMVGSMPIDPTDYCSRAKMKGGAE